MDLTDASTIVTDGAGGFGFATVRGLAQKGAKVVIADVSDERGEALAIEHYHELAEEGADHAIVSLADAHEEGDFDLATEEMILAVEGIVPAGS